jgi:hypothetical protein
MAQKHIRFMFELFHKIEQYFSAKEYSKWPISGSG